MVHRTCMPNVLKRSLCIILLIILVFCDVQKITSEEIQDLTKACWGVAEGGICCHRIIRSLLSTIYFVKSMQRAVGLSTRNDSRLRSPELQYWTSIATISCGSAAEIYASKDWENAMYNNDKQENLYDDETLECTGVFATPVLHKTVKIIFYT